MAAADTMPDNAHSFVGSQSYHNFAATGAFLNVDSAKADPGFLRDLNTQMQVIMDLPRP